MCRTQHVRTVLRLVPAEDAVVETTAENVEAALAVALCAVDHSAFSRLAKGADTLEGGGVCVVCVRLVIVVHEHSRHVGDAGDVTPLRFSGTPKGHLCGVVAVLFHCSKRSNRAELTSDHQKRKSLLRWRLLHLLLTQIAHKCPSRTFIQYACLVDLRV